MFLAVSPLHANAGLIQEINTLPWIIDVLVQLSFIFPCGKAKALVDEF